jgi:hypothetical protein
MARRDARLTAAGICAWVFRICSLLCPYSIGFVEKPSCAIAWGAFQESFRLSKVSSLRQVMECRSEAAALAKSIAP